MKIIRWLAENGEKYILISLSVVALVVSLLALSTEWLQLPHMFREHVPAGILILLASFVLFFMLGFERRLDVLSASISQCGILVEQCRAGIGQQVQKWEQLGIRDIFLGRDEHRQLGAYVELLANARQDLLIVGVTLKDVPQKQRPILIQKMKDGCVVRLLMLTPARWQNTEPVLDPVEPGDLRDHFCHAIRSIRELAKEAALNNKASGKPVKKRSASPSLEVRFYDQSPALSLTAADAEERDGHMRVEFTPHNETNQKSYFRPMMDLVHTNGESLIVHFSRHYGGLWRKAKPYLRVTNSHISRSPALDAEIARLLALEENWVRPDGLKGTDLT